MKSDFVQLVFALLVLVLGGVVEEMFPKILGVGCPVLLMATAFLAARRSRMAAVLFALAAGGVEDALSLLPVATSVSFFTVVALVSRTARLSWLTMSVAYPVYQFWLWLWHAGSHGFFGRLLVSVPMGLATAGAVALVLLWLEGRCAIDER